MHFPDPFSLTAVEKRRIQDFKKHVWTSPEVCNGCFTQVREIEPHPKAADLSESSLRNPPASFHERTEAAENEWTGFESVTSRYGKTMCNECGSDLGAHDHSQDLETLTERAKNLYAYTVRETPFDIDAKTIGRELARLHQQRDLVGYDRQKIALAWARAVGRRTTVASHTQRGSA